MNLIISFSCGLFLTSQSIGWQFQRVSPTTWNIKAGIIGLSFGWLTIRKVD